MSTPPSTSSSTVSRAVPRSVSGRAHHWWATVLVVAGVAGGLLSLDGLLVLGRWFGVAVGAVAVTAAATATARSLGRGRLAPSAWGLVTGAVLLGALYSGPAPSPTVPLPTPGAVGRWVSLLVEGVTGIIDGRVPVQVDRGVELLVVTGGVVAFLAADLLAVGLGRVGLSGLVLVAVWSPAVVFERVPTLGAFLLGAASYLLLLAVGRGPTSAGRSAHARDALTAVAAAVALSLVAVVVGPASTALPVFGSLRLPATLGPPGLDGPLRLATDLDMRASLDRRSDRTILSYTSTTGSAGPLRMYTLTTFDGASWHREDTDPELSPLDGVLWPLEARYQVSEDDGELVVRIADLDQDRLPIPVGPRSVDITSSWGYDAERDEVVGLGSTTRGSSYVVRTHQRDLTPDLLRADDPGDRYPPDSPYLSVPDSGFATEIASTALEVTAGATSAYDRALALQTYFRDGSVFRYDTNVPAAQTDDAVWDFLTERVGYCVQFATAMTVMARILGIPARLGVGFLPGRADPSSAGRYVVTGRQAHAWPELYFADAGWVRFEPTPATQTGAPPQYADPYSGQPTAPAAPEVPTPGSTQAPVPSTAPSAGTAGGTTVGLGPAQVPLAVAVTVLVALAALAAAGAGAVWWRRRGRHAPPPVDPDGWWKDLAARLAEHRVTWSAAATPRQVAVLVGEHYAELLRDGAEASSVERARAAIEELVAAVESTRYWPAPPEWSVATLRALVETAILPFDQATEAKVRVTSTGLSRRV